MVCSIHTPATMPMATQAEQREYQRLWIKQVRDSWVEKFGGKCRICGSTDELEFDHVYHWEKEIPVGQLWSRRSEVIEAELAKCQLLCSPCHNLATALDRGYGQHGIEQRYKEGCRCRPCRDAQAAKMRRYRAKVKAST